MRFSEILSRFHAVYQVPNNKRPQFNARVKNLQRLGWPEGTKHGRGKRTDWSDRQFKELALVVELCALGIPPERAIETAKANYPTLYEAAGNGSICEIMVPPSFGDAIPRSSILVNMSAAVS